MTKFQEEQILDNNKIARMVVQMARNNFEYTEHLSVLESMANDIILDHREISDGEEAIKFQTSMIMDMLLAYNEITCAHTEGAKEIRNIRYSNEKETIILNSVDKDM